MTIGVVGSINMDQVVLSTRIPFAGETVLGRDVEYKPGGKGANQAVALARLGANVKMFGKVGDDSNGKILVENLKTNNVDISNIETEKNVPTGLAVITVDDIDNSIVVISGANGKVDKKYIDDKIEEIKKCDIVIMQHEIPLDTNEYLIKKCKSFGIKTLLNPAPAASLSKEVIDNVDYITPNETEAKLIFNKKDDSEINDIIEENKGKVLVTLGSKGVAAYVESEGVVNVPCRKSKVVDTTGAGDTFNAAFVYAIMNGYNTKDALHFANTASGLSVEKLGAQSGMPTLEEVKDNL